MTTQINEKKTQRTKLTVLTDRVHKTETVDGQKRTHVWNSETHNGAALLHYPNWMDDKDMIEELENNPLIQSSWRRPVLPFFGVPQPRDTQAMVPQEVYDEHLNKYGEPPTYGYSGVFVDAIRATAQVQALFDRVNAELKKKGKKLNYGLLNKYDFQDSVSEHADDEPSIRHGSPIESFSFGATRRFVVRHCHGKTKRAQKRCAESKDPDRFTHKYVIHLKSGSRLTMESPMQEWYVHEVPKGNAKLGDETGRRWNITMREVDFVMQMNKRNAQLAKKKKVVDMVDSEKSAKSPNNKKPKQEKLSKKRKVVDGEKSAKAPNNKKPKQEKLSKKRKVVGGEKSAKSQPKKAKQILNVE